MATTFRNTETAEPVAHRFYGGATRGTQVELRPGAARVTFETPLGGEDGSVETLESLCEQIGAGRAPDYIERMAKGEQSLTSHIERAGVEAASPKSFGGALAQRVPVAIHRGPELGGIEDTLRAQTAALETMAHIAREALDEIRRG